MTFPLENLPIAVELKMDGVWTDITTYVYQRDLIRIMRGRRDEASEVSPTRCLLTLKNTDGRFNPQNPLSPYYGKIARNTEIRVSVDLGESYMYTDGEIDSDRGFFAPDEASISITGDLEVQYDGTLDNWHDLPGSAGTVELCGKGNQTGDQRSWLVTVRDRKLRFEWSEDGTSSTNIVTSTAELPVPATRRLAVKATIDVDNGASGHTVSFYWADTIDGTWMPLGEPVVTAGTTNIFDSTADLAVGNGWASLGFQCAQGKTHAMKLLSGIGGTEVANPDFRVQTPGDTTFEDDAGLTWTTGGDDTIISNRKVRFTGEVSKWPIEWETGGDDVYCQIEAYGVRRRLGRGVSPLLSALRRRIPTDPDLIAYWPLEDGANTTRPGSPIQGVDPMTVNRLAFEADNTLPGSDQLPTLIGTDTDNSYIHGVVPAVVSPGLDEWRVEFCFKIDELPSTGPWSFMRIVTREATVQEWLLQLNDAGGRVAGLDDDGTLLVDDSFVWTTVPEGDWYRLAFQVEDNVLSTYTYELYLIDIDDTSTEMASATPAGRAGRVLQVGGPAGGYHPDISGTALGHIAVFNSVDSTIFNEAMSGFAGETARERLARIAEEEGLSINAYGQAAEPLGPQRPADLMAVIQECADADQGVLGEEREIVGVQYLSRTVLYDQNPALTLDYDGDDGLVTPVTPVMDDRFIRNQIEVTRDGGTNQQAELLTGGPLAIDQVGRYFDSWNLNVNSDDRAAQAAGWKLHLGTWDEPRWTQITILLQNATHIIDEATALDVGAILSIDDPPSWLPPDRIDTMVEGYEEILHQRRWELTFNTSPAGAWRTVYTAAVDDADDAEAVRCDTAGCELSEAMDTTDTSALVHSSGEYRWADSATYPDDFPFDLNIGGERVTCTAITPYVQDTFTRSETDEWGTPDIGPIWNTNGGVATDFAVDGSAGTHTLTTVNFSRRSYIQAVHSDFDVRVDIATDELAAGASLVGGPTGRYEDSDNLYQARVSFTTTATVNLAILKRSGGVNTELAAVATGHTHVVDTFYRVRFRADGPVLRARIWLPSEPEPTHWHLEVEDEDLTVANFMGVYSVASTGNTNTDPVVSYDNYEIINAQVMTVTRSVNGVVKSQTAGTDVRLWNPPIIGL